MRILVLTNEYPPRVYGGAGVHVDHLTRALAGLKDGSVEVEVLAFGEQRTAGERLSVRGAPGMGAAAEGLFHPKLLDALYRNLSMVGWAGPADIVHCHTWYTLLAGCLLRRMLHAPLVVTAHSLEPGRPWKREQLGAAYEATCWLEETAFAEADGVIAVSEAMKKDVLDSYPAAAGKVHVVPNGIDTDRFRRVNRPGIPGSFGIDPDKPYVLFVGRITRQKGILHFVRALPFLKKGLQAVLCAGAPDTARIAEEMEARVADARRETGNPIVWIPEMLDVDRLAALYSHAAVFVCPSVYEPFGIVNLEAMACGTPVVAAEVGGIPEVVRHGETGLLVPLAARGREDPEPAEPERYAAALAEAVNRLTESDPERRRMGTAARRRVEERYRWERIAEDTVKIYRRLAGPAFQSPQATGRER